MTDLRGPARRGLDRAWETILRRVILPAGDRVMGQGLMRHLAFLEGAQWWSREQVLEYQDRSLRTLLETAHREVPFYRRLLDEAGVGPDGIRTAADLPRIPAVTKDMVRAVPIADMTRETGQRTWEASSSGSTGKNFIVLQDVETAGRLRACNTMAFHWGGWPLGQPHLQTGMTLDRGVIKAVKDRLLRCHYVSAFDLTDQSLDGALDLLERHDLRHLRGYPGSLYLLARRALETGRARPLDSILSWGDNLFPHYRAALDEAFSRRVHDTYGCAEGILVAAQCGEGMNYHLWSTEVIVEIVDDDDQPVPAGTPGHVLLTRLHPGPMPLIRYRVGDRAVLAGDAACPCGRGFEVFREIQGRDTDLVLTPSGNRLIVHFFTGILEFFREVDSFQVVQDQLEAITVRVVTTPSWDDSTADRIRQALAEKGASDLRIDVEIVDEIPLAPSQKRRFVVSSLSRP